MKNIDPSTLFPSLMLGAGESIDILVRMGAGVVQAYESDDQFALVDQRLRLRCILTSPEACFPDGVLKASQSHYEQLYTQTVDKLEGWGWEVRVVDRRPSINCIIVDRNQVLLANLSEEDTPPAGHHFFFEDSPLVGTIQDHFDKLWEGNQTLDLVYEDLLVSSIPDLASRIVVASKECWDRILAHLIRHPQDLRSMHPQNFEELVAELLIREGMRVEVTQPSKDGGRDILAWTETAAGPHLYLVECKRYGYQNPVGVSLVRALYGVVTSENATGGLIVTTSRFTRGAREFQSTVQNRLWLKDYEALLNWLRQV